MKTTSSALNFGFSAVRATRATGAVPQVIATTTRGSFRITSALSRVMDVKPGEYVMFLNNVAQIDAAIASKTEELVKFCEEQGLEFGSVQANIAIHNEFDAWAVAKGIMEYKPNGTVKTTVSRLSKSAKEQLVAANYAEALENALASDNEELKVALNNPDATKDAKIELIARFMVAPETEKFSGARVASPSGMNGTGLTLTLSDSNSWVQLKADLSDEEMTTTSRAFRVEIDKVQKVAIHNGYEEVEVDMFPLGAYTDKVFSSDSKEAQELDDEEVEE